MSTIYELFDTFLEKTVINKKSFFEETIEVAAVLGNLIEAYVTNGISNDKYNEILKRPKNTNVTFLEKAEYQFITLSESVTHLFASLLWLRYVPISDTKTETKKKYILKLIGEGYNENIIFPEPIASYSSAKRQIDDDIKYLIALLSFLWTNNLEGETTVDMIKQAIKNWILNKDDVKTQFLRTQEQSAIWNNKITDQGCPAIYNMLLNLCYPNDYEDIATTITKEKIVNGFEKLWTNPKIETPQPGQNLEPIKKIEETNIKLKEIREKVVKINSKLEGFKFHNPALNIIWSGLSDDNGISPLSALEYKKAIILYGPPGTSKTYSADKLATRFLFDTSNHDELEKYLKQIDPEKSDEKSNLKIMLDKDKKERIHMLQLHPNYSYEDFIWGYQIDEKNSRPKKGFLLKLIDQINEENKKVNENPENNHKVKKNEATKPPLNKHVLILDEINRVDLSRLFGELFSGIENRGEKIKLSIDFDDPNSKEVSYISVPENLYFIGTMNEIDFSLERVDFALRRRFVWFFHGFDEKILKGMLLGSVDYDDYIKRCKALNDAIIKNPDLGEQYQIGHTFFAEINKYGIKKQSKAKEVLWNISIKPMLEAYLGNMKHEDRDKLLKPSKDGKNAENFADIFLGKIPNLNSSIDEDLDDDNFSESEE